MRLTIRDVSEAAGVSIKTVSRVLNKEKYVREETRRRVEAAVAALNFHPSSAARALAGRRSFQVALLYDNPDPYYVYEIQAGARKRCLELGFRLIVQPCDVRDPGFIREIRALIDETRVDGVILSPPLTETVTLLDELKRRGVPIVRIAPGVRGGGSSWADMDDCGAAEQMTRYLMELGHRRIGFIKGRPDLATSAERLRGYQQALNAEGVVIDPAMIRDGRFDFASGREATMALLDLPFPPTAIFASDDDMAAGVLAVARERGIPVPDRLSIAGFDDADLAQRVWPQLTTIRRPSRDLAYAAADLLLDGKEIVRHRVLAHALVVRGSTAPPANATEA